MRVSYGISPPRLSDCSIFKNIFQSYCKCTPLTLQYLVADEKEFVRYPACDYEQCQLPDKLNDIRITENIKIILV